MPNRSRFSPGAPGTSLSTQPKHAGSAWAAELIARLSSIPLSQRSGRIEYAHTYRVPSFLTRTVPNTPPSNTAPPNSPLSAKNRTDYGSNRQYKLSSTFPTNKIKVLVTIEVITETEDMTCQPPETQPELLTSNWTRHLISKQQPHPQTHHTRPPSPNPIRPCPIKHVKRRPILNEDCSICCTVLVSETPGNLVWCKGACGNSFHKSCFDEWRIYAARPLRCVHWYVSMTFSHRAI